MKARIKATGEVVEVQWDSAYANEYYDTHFWYSPERNLHFHERELDFIEGKGIDWEQRTFDAAVAIMTAISSDSVQLIQLEKNCGKLGQDFNNMLAKISIEKAKALVAEYRKGE